MSYIEKIINKEYEKDYLIFRSEKLNKDFTQLKDLLEKYEESKELIKTEHKEVNSTLGKLLENVYNSSIGIQSMITHSQEHEKSEVENFLFFDYPSSVASLNKYNKSLDKLNISGETPEIQEAHKYAKGITEELIELRKRTVDLKEHIVVKRSAVVKKEVEKAQRASHKDVLKAKTHLNAIIEQIKEPVIKSNIKSITAYYERIKEALQEDDFKKAPSVRRRNDDIYKQAAFPVSELLKVSNIEYGDTHFTLKDKAIIKEQIEKEAEMLYDNLREFYVGRVSEKVAVILSDKNNLKEIETMYLGVRGEVEANLQFRFDDGSQFDISTNVELVNGYSANSKPFDRIPTRFHKVVTPDGELHTANLSQKLVQDLYKKEYPSQIENYLNNKIEGNKNIKTKKNKL